MGMRRAEQRAHFAGERRDFLAYDPPPVALPGACRGDASGAAPLPVGAQTSKVDGKQPALAEQLQRGSRSAASITPLTGAPLASTA